MLLTAAVQPNPPDYVALAMVLVFAGVVAVMAIQKRRVNRSMQCTASSMASSMASSSDLAQALPAPGSAGQIKQHNVDPKTAAMLMAITAYKIGKPLNELRFLSVKEVQ